MTLQVWKTLIWEIALVLIKLLFALNDVQNKRCLYMHHPIMKSKIPYRNVATISVHATEMVDLIILFNLPSVLTKVRGQKHGI